MRGELSADLESDGFCVLDQHLERAAASSLIAALAEPSDSDPGTSLQTATRAKRGVVFARRNLLTTDVVQSFISTSAVRSLIDCLAPGSVAVRAILFDKTGDANWTVPWHQDRSIAVRERIDVAGFGPWSEKAGVVHVQPPAEILSQMLTLRFSLDACDASNGPLRVIARTHYKILNQAAVDEAVKTLSETLCTTDAGGVVIMRPLILHASSPAKVVGHRRVLHIEFGPPTLPGGLAWAMV